MDDHLRCDPSNSRTTKCGPYAVIHDARSYSRYRLKNIACNVVFSERAYFLASRDGGPACGGRASHAPTAADQYVHPQSVDVAWPQHASHQPTVVHHLAGATGIAGYCEVNRAGNMLDASKTSGVPNGNAPRRLFVADVWGLPVSLRGFLQNLHVEGLPGYHLLSRTFSFRRALSPFAISGYMPPYSAASGHKSVPRSQSACKISELSFPCQAPHPLDATRRSPGPHHDFSVPSERILLLLLDLV